MMIKIRKIKKLWKIEIYNDQTLVKTYSLNDLNNFTILESDKINFEEKNVVKLDSSSFIIYRKSYPKIDKKAIITDSLKNIEKLYNKSFQLLDKYIFKNHNKRVFIGVLVKEDLANFINSNFNKAKIEHLVKWSINKSLTRFENYIFVKEGQIGLVKENVLIYKTELCTKSLDDIAIDISRILYNLLYKGTIYLIFNENLNDVNSFMESLRAKVEKQVLLVEQKIS